MWKWIRSLWKTGLVGKTPLFIITLLVLALCGVLYFRISKTIQAPPRTPTKVEQVAPTPVQPRAAPTAPPVAHKSIFPLVTAPFLIAMVIVLQGLRKIPADPPHKAVVTLFGKRTGGVKNEGWRFFFLYPLVNGAILVNMTRKNFDLKPEEVRTSTDMAEIEVSVSLTFQPDKDRLIEYLNSGGEDNVKAILSDVVEEAVREFAANPNQSPYTWEEAVRMKREFLAQIVMSILGEDPTTANSKEISSTAAKLRNGNGSLEMKTLGVVLNRVNVTGIKAAKSELAKAADKKAIEERERMAETIELHHVADRIEELVTRFGDKGMTVEKATQLVQTERSKVEKKIQQFELPISAQDVFDVLNRLRRV